jgi:outer membrane protein TolC
MQITRRALGVDEARVVVYHRPSEYRATYYARAEVSSSGLDTTLTQLRQGYEQGRFGQLDVLTAERARVAARIEYVRVLAAFHRGVAALERVVGAPIDTKP